MPYNGSGGFAPASGNPAFPGTTILSSLYNDTVNDIAAGLTNAVTRDGQGTMGVQFKLINGTSSIPGLGFNAETSTGIYLPSLAGGLAITSQGVEVARFKTNGAVLIGTTTDDAASKLQVAGILSITGAANTLRELIFRTGTVARVEIGAGTGAESGGDVGSDFYLNTFTDAGAYKATPIVVSRASGITTLTGLGVTGVSTFSNNVGIAGTLNVSGATTLTNLSTSGASSLASLSVVGNAAVGGALAVTGTTTTQTTSLGTTTVRDTLIPSVSNSYNLGSSSNRFLTLFAGTISDGATAANTLLGSSSTTVQHGLGSSWAQHAFYTSGIARVQITGTGLGVGDAPTYGLHALGTSTGSIVAATSTAASGSTIYMQANSTTDVRVGALTNHPLLFTVNGTERARIDTSGRFGVGVSPTVLCHIYGTGSTPRVRAESSGGCIAEFLADSNSAGYLGTNTNHPFIFTTNSAERMRLGADGVLLVTRTASRAGVFSLQVGNGSGDQRSLFTPNNVYAIGVSNGGSGSNGVYYIGASASASAPSLIFSNDGGTTRMTLTNGGVLDLVAGSGSLTVGGHITRFESAEQAAGVNSFSLSVAHGGSRVPDTFKVVLRCKSAEYGYSVGDEVEVQNEPSTSGSSVWASAASIGLVYRRTGTMVITDKTTQGAVAITTASWRLVFRAMWL